MAYYMQCEGTLWRKPQHDWSKWENVGNLLARDGTEAIVGFAQHRKCARCGLTETRREWY